jgi:two-component system, chemotaxis family, sensor kinase CheA
MTYDLVISDVEMPGLNGFELTARLRSLEEYRSVPVIIVSSLAKDEHKRKAIDAGAQAYIVKGAFEQGTLLDTVEALIG